jgi:hypothetical protein
VPRYRIQVRKVVRNSWKLEPVDETKLFADNPLQAATFGALHFGCTLWDYLECAPKEWMTVEPGTNIVHVLFVTRAD